MKRALIVGHEGQDGTYLFEFLHKKRYEVIGIGHSSVRTNSKKKIKPVDILKAKDVLALVKNVQPDEIYYLAAVHHSSQDLKKEDEEALFKKSFHVHVHGLIYFLDAMNQCAPEARLFYAASSHVFGDPSGRIQNERTPLVPVCVYGITKTAGVEVCQYYRRELGLFVSVGILYNHESPRRAGKFVSQKIVQAAIAIKEGRQQELVLGDLNAAIDWGYAGDYVEAMHKMLRHRAPDDFIVASGKIHTVRQFVEGVFGYLGLDWKKFVREDKRLIKKAPKRHLQGDYSKLKKATSWTPKTDFKRLIEIMVNAGVEDGR
jgi:GDPmannose 4,6-dehydratase